MFWAKKESIRGYLEHRSHGLNCLLGGYELAGVASSNEKYLRASSLVLTGRIEAVFGHEASKSHHTTDR